MPSRRQFLATLAAAVGGLGHVDESRAPARTAMCLAYTSFVVRTLQGRDILKTTASGHPADAFLARCAALGAGGVQMDATQLASTEPAYLKGLREAADTAGLAIELSVPSRHLDDEDAFAKMVEVSRALGADRWRVAMLYGRRYESFKTRDEWQAFAATSRATLVKAKPLVERARIAIGIENHKDWTAADHVELLRTLDSEYFGATVDFGNNVSLLEDPLDTARQLAPWAVTTHVKDMAVRPVPEGFELSEVPLGEGFLPLGEMVKVLRARRPDVRLVLEMITRDPLLVPYKTDRYWVAIDRPAPDALARFERDVLGRAWDRPLPRVSHLAPPDQLAAEDANVQACLDYARRSLS